MNLIQRTTYLSLLLVLPAFAQVTTEKPAAYLRQATVSETADSVRVTANSPRPLLQVLDALLQKYGWIVNYEDPAYVSDLDVVEAPDGIPHSHVPAGGPFTVEFPANKPDQEKTLRLIVDFYNQSKYPGRFELRHSGDTYSVVGTAAHDAKGAMSPEQPLLDLPVTLPAQERTIVDTIDLICHSLAAQRHTTVIIGVQPRNLIAHTSVKIGGSKVPARELLLQCLAATHHTLYWRLFFDPNTKGYVVNIHAMHSS